MLIVECYHTFLNYIFYRYISNILSEMKKKVDKMMFQFISIKKIYFRFIISEVLCRTFNEFPYRH